MTLRLFLQVSDSQVVRRERVAAFQRAAKSRVERVLDLLRSHLHLRFCVRLGLVLFALHRLFPLVRDIRFFADIRVIIKLTVGAVETPSPTFAYEELVGLVLEIIPK
jgi:hypothetical protein